MVDWTDWTDWADHTDQGDWENKNPSEADFTKNTLIPDMASEKENNELNTGVNIELFTIMKPIQFLAKNNRPLIPQPRTTGVACFDGKNDTQFIED